MSLKGPMYLSFKFAWLFTHFVTVAIILKVTYNAWHTEDAWPILGRRMNE